MHTALRLCLVMVWLIAARLPASGASVIFYSKADNSYGWCAGYSYSRGESCAREQCLAYGSGCELAIECDGYWSATAFAPDPYEGFGASCEWPSAGAARGIALLSCIYASHALCSTSAAFDGNARSASETANSNYDLAWYTQNLLLGLGYDIGEVDGEIGSRTRAAIADFQSIVGLEPTGEADWTMMGLLLLAYGGTARFVGDIIAQTDAADQHIVQTYAYRYAGAPAADLSLAAELARLEDGWRRTVVAALVSYSDAACTLPASAVGGTDAAETWTVSCLEGDYLLSLGGPTPVVTRAEGPVDIKPLPVACPPEEDFLPTPDAQQQVKPSPNTLNGPPPESTRRQDCLMTQVMRLKPSPNTVNSKPPTVGNLVPIQE
jgi:peptidoglycan hydrolase-like protein with peptidoglycan-binding domain